MTKLTSPLKLSHRQAASATLLLVFLGFSAVITSLLSFAIKPVITAFETHMQTTELAGRGQLLAQAKTDHLSAWPPIIGTSIADLRASLSSHSASGMRITTSPPDRLWSSDCCVLMRIEVIGVGPHDSIAIWANSLPFDRAKVESLSVDAAEQSTDITLRATFLFLVSAASTFKVESP